MSLDPDPALSRGPADRRLLATLVAAAGLLGLSGVAISAAASHAGGGSLATTAGLFLLLHAGAVIGLAAWAKASGMTRTSAVAGAILVVGTILFSGDLAMAGLTARRPFPAAAPLGGSLLLAGWLLVIITGLLGWRRRS